MLRVRAIQKYYDEQHILIGYTIQDVNNPDQRRNVTKDVLKQAIINGQCECVNMTLTSDGRLIGHAAEQKQKKAPAQVKSNHVQYNHQIQKPIQHQAPVQKPVQTPVSSSRKDMDIKLIGVFTNGKKISAGLIDDSEFQKQHGRAFVEGGYVDGLTIEDHIKHNIFSNLTKTSDDKYDMSSIKRQSFSKVKDKLLKKMAESNFLFNVEVGKGQEKGDYEIVITNYESMSTACQNIATCLLLDAMYTAKIKVNYIEDGVIVVKGLTGIADVRKAVKLAKW